MLSLGPILIAASAYFGLTAAIFPPIATDKPNPVGGSVANGGPPTAFFAGHSPPYPTDDWWVGYAATPGNA